MNQQASNKIVSGLGERRHSHSGTDVAALRLDEGVYARALDCVQCGLCLPACPTYIETGREADSPRGRIHLMKSLADGDIAATGNVIAHLDRCIDCHGCETACPSGVVYHELIEQARDRLSSRTKRTIADRLARWIILSVLPCPARLKPLLVAPRLLQKVGLWSLWKRATRAVLPRSLSTMQAMLPATGAIWPSRPNTFHTATSSASEPNQAVSGSRVGLLIGCAGSVLFDALNRQTIALLQHFGCDVVVPAEQKCCGAIHQHAGEIDGAKAFARSNIKAFERAEVDFVISNAAGCGAMLKEYERLLQSDTTCNDGASKFVSRVRDVCEYLSLLDLPTPTHSIDCKATYHDACHLAHAQHITDAPRALLQSIPGLQLIPLAEADLCCGAGGSYNLTQPEMADQLAKRKLDRIKATGATICVTGNIGCALQITAEAARRRLPLEVVHPVTLLHRAYFGKQSK